MKVFLTRDSVHPADDACAPHERVLGVSDELSVDAVIAAVAGIKYFPQIVGGCATWSLTSRRPIAVLAQQWREPKRLRTFVDPADVSDLQRDGDTIRVHATYHRQVDPDVVVEVLTELCCGGLPR